jgi:phosphinothricin acetyltransferase
MTPTLRGPLLMRSARPADAAAMLTIYAPYVEQTAVSFELAPPSLEEFTVRLTKALQGWAWLLAEQDGVVVGYAYGSSHRDRPAYRWSTETSVYVAPGCQRQGIGRALMHALLLQLEQAGLCNAYAGVALPNPASEALHLGLGFRPIGSFPAVGRKFDSWHDVAWFHKQLRDQP